MAPTTEAMGTSTLPNAVPRGHALELTHAAKTYVGPPAVTALRDANLVLGRGAHLAVMGPSGSGKSTLLNIAGLLDTPSSGAVYVDGIPAQQLDDKGRARLRRNHIGFVFQSFHLLESLSIVENVELALEIADGRRRRHHREDALVALESVGVLHRWAARPAELSGGEQQRVAVARALVRRPALLLMDEPTGNLDATTSHRVLDAIDGIRTSELSLLTITHDQEVAQRADGIGTIDAGRLVAELLA